MVALPRLIQGLILFTTAFGALFLWEVYPPVLPWVAFDIIAFGWILFVADSVLTFVRPKISFYLGMILAAIALGETLLQPGHYALIASGNVPATVTIVVGTIAEVLIISFVAYYLITERGKDPWAWPGGTTKGESSEIQD